MLQFNHQTNINEGFYELFFLGDEREEEIIGPSAPPDDPPEVSMVKRVEVEIQERKDTKPGVPHVREWDRGKGKLIFLMIQKK